MASALNPDKSNDIARAGKPARQGIARFAPVILPFGLLLLALIVPSYMFQKHQKISAVGLGPAAWPSAMLAALAVFCVLWCARDIWLIGWAGRKSSLVMPEEDEHYHFGKAVVGLVLIIAYGWLLPIFGFAISTTFFIAIWCVVGGLRNWVVILPVTIIGTIALLWLFMGLARMPLPRGTAMYGDFSIWLLRFVGIY